MYNYSCPLTFSPFLPIHVFLCTCQFNAAFTLALTSAFHTLMTSSRRSLTKCLAFPTPDTSLQLRRDVIFCQAATGALCTLAEQLLAALRSRFNNAGEYQEDGKETSRKWLEQISVIGVLLYFQSTLAPHVVRTDLIFPFDS